MSQSHLIANLDRREYIDPTAVSAWNVPQLMSLESSAGAMTGLALLIAASYTGSTGEGHFGSQDPEGSSSPLAAHLIGRWAGERIAIIGDCYPTGRPLLFDEPDDVFAAMRAQAGEWVDISEHIVALMDLDDELHCERHEVHMAPAGVEYSIAQGLDVNSTIPRAPRSTMDMDTGAITAIPTLPPVDPYSEPTVATPLTDPEDISELDRLLAQTSNMFGTVNSEGQAVLRLAATHPTPRTWAAAAHTIVQEKRMITLWQAVGAVDQDCPASLSMDELHRPVWGYVPDGHTILAALALTDRAGEDEQVAASIHARSHERLAKALGDADGATKSPAGNGQRSRRNYRRMGDEKLMNCHRALRLRSGDAYDRCLETGCDPTADLHAVEEIASERGLI